MSRLAFVVGALAAALLIACPPTPKVEPVATDSGVASTSTTSTTTATTAPSRPPMPLGTGRVNLPVDGARLGVTRTLPRVVRQGPSAEDPAVAVTPQGRVFVAFSVRQGPREYVTVRRAASPGAPLSPPRRWSEGDRAWHPRLTVTSSGAVWLTWCGRDRQPPRGDHRRAIYTRQIAPTATRVIEVSPPRSSPRDRRRHCDPDVWPTKDGGLHVVWESARATSWLSSRVMYRRVRADGSLVGRPEEVSIGPFDRRPRIAETKDGRLWIAWDRFLDDGPRGVPDPDYDVFVATRTASVAWGDAMRVDAGSGIQAAPRLTVDGEGNVLVAYHSSRRHGLVKWWSLVRIAPDGTQHRLAAVDQAALLLPAGQQQGAELPAIAVGPEGRIVLATRVSHGAYLHVVDRRGILPALDLTRRGWGARGLRMDMTFAPDGSLLLARRARHNVVLERFVLSDDGQGAPDWEPMPKNVGSLKADPPPLVKIDSRFAPTLRGTRIAYGDVHMHSAVSDGTGPPDEIIARAWARGLDFAVLTDHDYVVGARMMLSEHDENQWLTDVFDARTDFVALHGYEWTTMPVPRGSGHKNVYFRSHGPSPLIGSRGRAPRTRALQNALASEDAFTAPHHTGWTGTDWDQADPRIQRHLEIVSVHGAFEDPKTQPIPTRAAKRGMFAVDGLRRGNKFGFIGGSDAHGILWHHGVGRRMDPWGHGLTGVIVERNQRPQIWDALYARRTFATSGARMWVVTAIEGAVLGGLVERRPPIRLRWQGAGTVPLTKLSVVRDGTMVHEQAVDSMRTEGTWEDKNVRPGRHSYYVRITQGEGIEGTDVAWSSPIFVVVPP
ncbi:MAG: CehA/McbA family metallohydrolase [Deltaproteobacteria bacterium]